MKKLLLVTPNKKDFDEHIVYLQSEGFDFDYEKNDRKIIQRIEEEGFSGVVFSYKKEWKQCIALCSDVKKQAEVPVFMVSEHKFEEDALEVIRKGVFYFPQGSNPLYISSIIKMYLNESQKQRENELENSREESYDIEIKESTKQIFIEGKAIKCARKTYDLWRYLLEQGDSYTPDEEIYRDVWETEILHGYKDSIRVHIKKIRDCIPDNLKDLCFIENARGRGYRFVGRFRTIKSLFFI